MSIIRRPASPSTTPATPAPTTTTPTPAAPRPLASTAAAPAPTPFSDGLDPRPQPAAGYAVDFAPYNRWNSVELGPSTGTAGPHVPAVAEAGKPLTIRHNRGPADVGLSGELKSVEMRWRLDGGPVQSAVVADGSRDLRTGALVRLPVKIDLPETARGEVEYWFRMETTDGREMWDSDYGRNFRVNIMPAGGAVVRFDDLWGETVHGPIKAGETLRLAYDVDRIKQFLYATRHHGYETWSASAFVSFDGKQATELPLTTVKRGQYGETLETVPFEAAIEVPADARTVSIWFKGTSYGGSVHGGPAWDSNQSANYNFTVQP